MAGPSRRFASALITGASSGIGAALARALAAEGTEVVLAARREQALRALADEIIAAGGRAHVQVLDVADPAHTEAVVRELDEAHALELVIANAGTSRSRHGTALRWEDCASIIDVNIRGAVATLTGAIPGMVARGHGHLVGVSSVAQYRGLPGSSCYAASKAFLSTFLEGLRIDLASAGVAVTDVRPGFVDTPMSASVRNKIFEVEVDYAAQKILDAASHARKVLVFPPAMGVLGPLLAGIPRAVYEPVMRLGSKPPSKKP
ncbi:SDR family NAD(P)-dependent oxidoreductase [Pseudenhygromyxa sp. WMMC2535]|uniref:SDR family NAD(P)-dependent oxidoreductase n=1 Tax=Pseudenhygromyxa sp. WMMC2535 TaxID=2712867 RepID=UPI001556515C|nr:SDR family NAD(P)-dependent oxidoreductase [Pseudenhygromyxa sp. WMMC2535]NVB38134.1 SDR family NAD(P)-dependent oxidoreductase [Pseudenhygromyxa sp. WMMC2535]